ncbi:MAG TPA: hypothetical protein VFI13_01890 [Gemmatimonadales bacterium]|nr:hypothetical protein [Gemmatimonadales bacterium]
MSRRPVVPFAALLLAAGCLWHGSPVPVAGDFSRYAGHWEGSYASIETGRSGSIIFELTAGTDSAYGDVMMVPVQNQGTRAPGDQRQVGTPAQAPRPLKIAFVRSEEDRVTGTLELYQDPETGESLLTKFQGRLRGNEIKGTYSTLGSTSGRVLTGEWSVKRTKG